MSTPEQRRAAQRENQNYFSGKVSELSRTMGFGLAAIGFALISTDSSFYTSLPRKLAGFFVFAAATGCATVLLDYLQNAFGWGAATDAAENDKDEYRHSPVGKFFRKCQDFCFYAKQVVAVLGGFALLFAIVASQLK